MTKTYVTGFLRIGKERELKKITENYFKSIISEEELIAAAKELRKKHWEIQKNNNIDYISSNDFSFYDGMLDTSFLLNVIPKRYKDLPVSELEKYFAMARGYQKNDYDVKALEMKKWFNTNYHYVVPEIDEDTEFKLNGIKLFSEIDEAKSLNIDTKPVIIGPYTFLKLSKILVEGKNWYDYSDKVAELYIEILQKIESKNVSFVQIDEPGFVMDLDDISKKEIISLYNKILSKKGNNKILINTYFGDIRDIYNELQKLDIDAIGLDFVEGIKNIELIEQYGNSKLIFAGVINGKNIWRNNYENSIKILEKLNKYEYYIGTSCSLLHVPYSLENEKNMDKEYLSYLSFAVEKLGEIVDLKEIDSMGNDYINSNIYIENQKIIQNKKNNISLINSDVREKVKNVENSDFYRKNEFPIRKIVQNDYLNLPILPTTTIGSFPQTNDVRKIRKELKTGQINGETYINLIKEKIDNIIKVQEDIGLDVLVHGEYERNDMVEYFGENLSGFIFTENGWVQSYGTRGVKPPIIIGDISREKAITVDWIKYAQSKTDRIVKGMLTGPVTILNWSFPREDISNEEMSYQIALAIKDEVEDLEKAGIKIIQIDEAALREKLPLRKEDWNKLYLNWAIKSFRITCSGVENKTQIHSHFCYSEFSDIFADIDEMDADVITIEAAKSDLKMVDFISKFNYKKESGPGVYDIHSPRVPTEEEFGEIIIKMIEKIGKDKLWINPDCGLKTRGEKETYESLKNMVKVANKFRN